MKDAKGHGSGPRGAHSAGISAIGKPVPVVPTALAMMRNNPQGFSVTPGGQKPTSGYMVSVPGRTQFMAPGDAPDRATAFARQNSDLFQTKAMHIGGWHDPATGKFHLDPSENIKDRATAKAAGRARNQIGIYDVARRKFISTGGTGG